MESQLMPTLNKKKRRSSPKREFVTDESEGELSRIHVEGFLVRDNRVFDGPLGRSLRLFARAAQSTHSLCSALLRYTRFARLLHS